MPCIAHAPSSFFFLITFFLLWAKLFDQLQSFLDYLVVRRDHEKLPSSHLYKRLYYSKENSVFKLTACLFLSSSPPWAVLAIQLFDSRQQCVCIFLLPAPWGNMGNVHFAVVVPDHHSCVREHSLYLCWNSLFKKTTYIYTYYLLQRECLTLFSCGFWWLQWKLQILWQHCFTVSDHIAFFFFLFLVIFS